MKDSILFLLKTLLKKNEIKVDYKELDFQLLSHPSYPSMLSIIGVMDHFGIQNIALEIPISKESLTVLPDYFLARIKYYNGDQFVLVTKKESDYELMFEANKKEKFSLNQFIEAWTGIIIAIEKSEHEVAPAEGVVSFKKGVLFLTTIVLLLVPFLFNPALFPAIHFTLSLVGVAVSVLIKQYELGLQSRTLDKFCSEDNKSTSCNAVLNSKGATLLKFIKLSDMGLIYFSGLTLAWVLISVGRVNYNLLIILSVLAAAFTLYSIYYQYKVVKKWCLLCLCTVTVLWLQVASTLILDLRHLTFFPDIYSSLIIALCFLCAIALWLLLLPKFKDEEELKKIKIDYYKFKRNFSLFKALITKSDPISTSIDGCAEMVFGNKGDGAPLKIVIITNPLCGHCKEAHRLAEQLLKKYHDKLQLCIRFNINVNEANDYLVKAGARLLELYHLESEQKSLQALHEVYIKLGLDEWLKKWGAPKDSLYVEVLKKENEWCRYNKINFTPEILINGLSFPNEYDRSDLLYFIDDLLDDVTSESKILIPHLEFTA